MTLINALGYFAPRGKKFDFAVFLHGDITVLPEFFHGNTDAGLGKSQFFCNIDGMYDSVSLLNHQNGFKIVFCAFVNIHMMILLLIIKDIINENCKNRNMMTEVSYYSPVLLSFSVK